MVYVALGFNNKIRYILYVSSGSQILYNKAIKVISKDKCSIYNVLSMKGIILDSKQWKDNSDLRVKTPIPQEQLTD